MAILQLPPVWCLVRINIIIIIIILVLVSLPRPLRLLADLVRIANKDIAGQVLLTIA